MKSNYEVAQPTPEAAILDGMYCRRGSSRRRRRSPSSTRNRIATSARDSL